MSRYSGPLRRSALIGASGVGAIIVSTNGTSLIAAGLDHWFERGYSGSSSPDLNEYKVEEWRLQRELQVDHFRLPPDFREPRPGPAIPNSNLTIPFLRFPRWHVCRFCHRLQIVPSSERGVARCTHCPKLRGFKRGSILSQVPFVAMCDYGHIQEFPWNEWVHSSTEPSCRGQLELQATGAASLNSIRVRCITCGSTRTMAKVTSANVIEDGGETTHLSQSLSEESGDLYLCRGQRPWHDDTDGHECGRHVRGALLSASNVYFSLTRSAIYLPRSSATVPSDLVAFLEGPIPSSLIKMMRMVNAPIDPGYLRGQYARDLTPYTNVQIEQALGILDALDARYTTDESSEVEGDPPETRFRREEFLVLRKERAEPQLKVRHSPTDSYQSSVARFFSRIMLIDTLRETRVQYGFNRVFPESQFDVSDRKAFLWSKEPAYGSNWLPANIVYGEGIYLELDELRLRDWEQRPEIEARIIGLVSRYARVQHERHLKDRQIDARFVLIHTFAHLLINRLAFECGYSSASLRERLYVSSHPEAPMAGLLIYTAAGDSDGTLGGLVRMGKPGNLEPVIRRALEVARWCSSDPVCMELGEQGRQGPDSCNLAACHSCALLSETSCEEFNRFLDRAVVVGTLAQPGLGFFDLS